MTKRPSLPYRCQTDKDLAAISIITAAGGRFRSAGSLRTRSLGHALSLASGRRLGADPLRSLTTQSTSSMIRRAAGGATLPPAANSFNKTGGGNFKGLPSLEAPHQSQPKPHLGTVREDPELEAARLSRLPAAKADKGGKAPYTFPDGVSPFTFPGSPSSGDVVIEIPEETAIYDAKDGLAMGSAAHSVLCDPTFLRTAEVAEHVTLLARLRGVGLYYTDNRCVGCGSMPYIVSSMVSCPLLKAATSPCLVSSHPRPCSENNSHGIPPVMWAFLRNVEAVHEFAILLQNRFLPIPYLTEDERLAAVPVPGIPNFFRVSETGRYGLVIDCRLSPTAGVPRAYNGGIDSREVARGLGLRVLLRGR